MTFFTRRYILAGLAASLALPVLAQGKKTAGGSDPFASPATGSIAGRYDSRGLNADGSSYSGVADVTVQGNAVEFTWVVQGDTMHGSGTIDGRVVTVDWGSKTPVIYVVMPDGTLHGTWDDGLALEKLTPR